MKMLIFVKNSDNVSYDIFYNVKVMLVTNSKHRVWPHLESGFCFPSLIYKHEKLESIKWKII
jgi:hypothetical protein